MQGAVCVTDVSTVYIGQGEDLDTLVAFLCKCIMFL